METENKAAQEPEKPAEKDTLAELARFGKLAGLGAALFIGGVWLVYGAILFAGNRQRLAKLAPVIEQAESEALDFDRVAADPAAAAGKRVLWCVQNINEGQVNYNEDQSRRLVFTNYPKVPLTYGGKQNGCQKMVLAVKGARRLDSGLAIVDAEFVAIP